MKKISAIVLTLVLCVGLLTGCGESYSTQDSTVFVLKKGNIIATDVERFDSAQYSENALKAYVEEAISEYNVSKARTAVTLKELTCEEGVATLILEYTSAEDYADFNGIDFYAGSLAEALAGGYGFHGDFAEITKDGVKECMASDFINGEKYKVAIIKANTNLSVPGNIRYVSANNVSIVDNKTVAIRPGTSLLGKLLVEEPVSETTETKEPEITTETETEIEVSGSVGEDELVIEEEVETETEIVFEFVEEEAEDVVTEGPTVQYSNVYTYVIYK